MLYNAICFWMFFDVSYSNKNDLIFWFFDATNHTSILSHARENLLFLLFPFLA